VTERHRVIRAGAGRIIVARRGIDYIGGNRGRHCSSAGHSAHGDIECRSIVGCNLCDDWRKRAGDGAAQGHIRGDEGGGIDRLAENSGEVDRAAVSRVGLSGGLIDRNREGEQFIGADIAVRTLWTRHAALVEVVHRR
jgi:hypothetical protein